MISGRTLNQGTSTEAKMGLAFGEETSTCALSEDDLSVMGLSGGGNVLIASPFGREVLRIRADKGLPSGMVFIPMGPWANSLVGPDTYGCGMPNYKGVEVEVTPTKEPVKNIRELFAALQRI